MTNKQIIIDGINVSECPYYIDSEGSCSSHDCECIKCVHNVCFYKDYKAKEQECEELKETINGLLKIQYQLADSCKKYIQTLTEIKEIARGVRNYLDCPSPRDVRYEMDIILQKISECEAENEN